MFQYDHRDADTAWPEGQYPATLTGVIDTTSKSSGQPMQEWTFTVYNDATGKKQTIKDYVTPNTLFKVRMLAGALNRADEFKQDRFIPEDHIGSNVMVKLIIEEQEGYDDKNKVSRISANPGSEKPSPTKVLKTVSSTGATPVEDDIPF